MVVSGGHQRRHLPNSPKSVVTSLYTGAVTWLERWVRPSCWIALSADHGSSIVKWRRRRRFLAECAAWREMPVEAASLITATFFLPSMKNRFSMTLRLSISLEHGGAHL